MEFTGVKTHVNSIVIKMYRLSTVFLTFQQNTQISQSILHPGIGIGVGAGDGMQVDAFGQQRQRGGSLFPAAFNKLSNLITVGELKRAGKLTIDGVVHHYVNNSAALIHDNVQLVFHLVTPMAAGKGSDQTGGLAGQHIATGRGGDVHAAGPKQSHVTYNNLAADGKQTGKGGGADRAIGLFQRAGNGLSSLLSVHETSSYVKIVVMSAV